MCLDIEVSPQKIDICTVNSTKMCTVCEVFEIPQLIFILAGARTGFIFAIVRRGLGPRGYSVASPLWDEKEIPSREEFLLVRVEWLQWGRLSPAVSIFACESLSFVHFCY